MLFKKYFFIFTLFCLSIVSCGNKYDVELSQDAWEACIFWLEEYYIDTRPVLPEYQAMHNAEKTMLSVGLDLSTSEDDYNYDITTTDVTDFYYDLRNKVPMANYVCDYWYELMDY